MLLKIYQLFGLVKHQILFSAFGVTFKCKHTPTCSRYLADQIKSHGTIRGFWRSFLRLLSCW